MDTEGIGTDATIAEHIQTILARKYAIKNDQQRFEPTSIGLALVEGYVDSVFLSCVAMSIWVMNYIVLTCEHIWNMSVRRSRKVCY